MISLDLETFLIEPGRQAPPIVVMSLAVDQDAALVPVRDVTPRVEALLNAKVPILGHNVAFDLACISAHEPDLLPGIFQAYEEDRVLDTGLRQKLLDNARGCLRGFLRRNSKAIKINYALDGIVERLFKVTLDKTTWRLRYHELADVPIEDWPDGARKYALEDAIWPNKVFAVQEDAKLLEGQDALEDHGRQARFAFFARLMSCWGLITDPVAVREFAEGKRADREALARHLQAAGLVSQKRDGSWKREQSVALEKIATQYCLTRRQCPTTETGRPALDEAACVASGDPDLVAYARFSSLTKELSTDVPLVESGTRAPIHARFEELLETGRTSSSPNVQNLPRHGKMRECFVPRSGFIFAAADFSKLELHTWAQILIWRFGESKLAEALNFGRDPHTEVAARILGITYEDALARVAAGDPEAKNARDCAKPANFGFPGGLGAKTFVKYALGNYGVGISEGQAAKLKSTWFEQWSPDPQRYFAWMGQEDSANRPIRHPKSHRFRGRATYTARCNGYFQGLGADAMKAAAWDIGKACYVDRSSILYGSRPVNEVHDEFILEVPERIGHECAHELARLMQVAAASWTPDCPVQVGAPVLMRRWSKDAKSKLVDGRLVPWG